MQFLMIIFLFLFMMSNHPFLMIFMLILITLMMSIIIFYSMITSWFSYVLLIIMLSGMMIIFMYMATLSPNEQFKWNVFPIIIIPLILLLSSYAMHYSTPHIWSIKQVNSSFISFTIILVSFLFMMMVTMTKITFWHQGPMSSS